MTWIRVDASLSRHPKVKLLAASQKISRNEAVGLLVSVWSYAVEFHEDGDLSAVIWPALAQEIGYMARRGTRIQKSLQEAGFLTRDGHLNDWHEYQGALVVRRRLDRERKAGVRRTSAGHPQDVGRMSARHPTATDNTNGTVRTERTEKSSTAPRALDAVRGKLPLSSHDALDGHLRASRNPDALLAELTAMHDGLRGDAITWDVLGRTLEELAVEGGPCTPVRLRAFAKRLLLPDGPAAGEDAYDAAAKRLAKEPSHAA